MSLMNTPSHYPPRAQSRAEGPLPPPPPIRERGDSNSSQTGFATPSSITNTIQIPTSSNASVRTSPQKAHIRTYDSKLISREMDRLATHPPTPVHSHSHSHSHTGTPMGTHGHGMSAAGSVSTLSLALVPTMTHPHGNAPSLAPSASASAASDDPWSVLHVQVLPLFNGEPLRMPIEDLNALVKRHLQTVVSKSPSRAISTLEADVVDLLSTGMITLNAKLSGLEDDQLLGRVIELWGFFWEQILPYIEGVRQSASIRVAWTHADEWMVQPRSFYLCKWINFSYPSPRLPKSSDLRLPPDQVMQKHRQRVGSSLCHLLR